MSVQPERGVWGLKLECCWRPHCALGLCEFTQACHGQAVAHAGVSKCPRLRRCGPLLQCARCAEDSHAPNQCTAHERGAGVWLNLEIPLTQKRRWAVWSGGSSGSLDH